MGGGKAPKAPDASAIAAQQFGQNVDANTAGAFQNNPSVYTPYGSSQFSQSGTHTVNGQEVPTFRQDVSLSPDQQQLYGQQQAISSAGNQLAIEQQNAAQGRLGAIDPGQLSTNVNIPGQQSYGGAGRLMTNFDSGGAVQSQAGRDVGGVTQDRVNTNPRLNRSFSGYGNVQRSLGPNDFEDSRRRVEGAINSRLDPQLQRGRAELESRLANQGVMPGSEGDSVRPTCSGLGVPCIP